jgi:agmatine deiminase
MPAEWSKHQATLMAWPTTTRAALWGELFRAAKRDYAEIARRGRVRARRHARRPGSGPGSDRRLRTENFEVMPVPIDDSWVRDNGPIFVTDGRGGVALVHFGFNSWGERFLPYDRDARVPRRSRRTWVRRYVAR